MYIGKSGWLMSSLIGVFGFSLFSLCLLLSDDLVFFWLFLELSGLCLIPCFFCWASSVVSFISLFTYVVVSSISSSMMLAGMLYPELVIFFLLGVMIKFGVFPFFGWLYIVLLDVNWLVVWCISGLGKISFVFLCFFLSGLLGGVYAWLVILSFVSLLFLSFIFWVYTYSWRGCWTHMMISSSVLLVLMSFSLSLDLLSVVFIVYFVWCTVVVSYLGSSWLGGCMGEFKFDNIISVLLYIFFLVSTPISFSLFYKLSVSYCVFSCGALVVLGWVIYSFSEQFYLVKYVVSACVPKGKLDYISVV